MLLLILVHPERLRPSAISSGGDDTAFVRKSFDSEPGISYNRTPRRNQNKGLKKRRRRKSAEEKEAEKFPFSISSHQDGHPIFSASVYQLRYKYYTFDRVDSLEFAVFLNV